MTGKENTAQVYTFGQHNKNDLGINHRPLWRLMKTGTKLYPEQIKVESWRQRNGDARGNPDGRVPGDVFDHQYQPASINDKVAEWLSAAASDINTCAAFKRDIEEWFKTCNGSVFDFPRVTGNSAQRCDWHPTQLHESLVERCIRLCTPDHDTYDGPALICDTFSGTGTTLRVCERIGRNCQAIEIDRGPVHIVQRARGRMGGGQN